MSSKKKINLHIHAKVIPMEKEAPVEAFERLAEKEPYAFLLESADNQGGKGRFSYIGYEPKKLLIFAAESKKNPIEILKKTYEQMSCSGDRETPGLQCGFVGYFSYETVRHLEKLDIPTKGTVIPEGIFFLPRKLLIFDHVKKTIRLVAYDKSDIKTLYAQYKNKKTREVSKIEASKKEEKRDGLKFKKMVTIAQEKIKAGEIFQVVLSRIFKAKTNLSPIDLYRNLRAQSPSPYLYYLRYPDFSIIGSSPETLVKVDQETVTIHPIAGTRPRGKDISTDKKLEIELKSDLKERAEHMMLVDLGRNDIGRIARPGSVKVTRLMQIEKYRHVMHLVSEIKGIREKNQSLFDVFEATFPAGTLTGAPKIRAMNIIGKLEKTPREIYGGAVGYFDLSGSMDFAIAIRTILFKDGEVTIRAGAGIVYDSNPESESQECENKAKGPLTALAA